MDRVRLVRAIRIASDLGLHQALRIADALLAEGWTFQPTIAADSSLDQLGGK